LDCTPCAAAALPTVVCASLALSVSIMAVFAMLEKYFFKFVNFGLVNIIVF
jgi:hypothetical protein